MFSFPIFRVRRTAVALLLRYKSNTAHCNKARPGRRKPNLIVVYLVCRVAQYLDLTSGMAPIAETQTVMAANGRAPNAMAPNAKVQI